MLWFHHALKVVSGRVELEELKKKEAGFTKVKIQFWARIHLLR